MTTIEENMCKLFFGPDSMYVLYSDYVIYRQNRQTKFS